MSGFVLKIRRATLEISMPCRSEMSIWFWLASLKSWQLELALAKR
jgi:hypothetical protein